MADVLWLSEKDVTDLLSVESALPLVEAAFAQLARGEAQMPPKLYLEFKEFNGDLRAMPAYLPKTAGPDGRPYAGVKVVNSHPDNPRRGLPTVQAVYVLNDPETGAPLAMMAAGRLTDVRTGAAGGVAAKYLARRDSKILGLVGAGRQAGAQWEALSGLFGLTEVRVAAATEEESAAFCRRHHRPGGPLLRSVGIPEACDADIVVTTTPGRRVVVRPEWIKDGTHINAIGADAPGKQELDAGVLQKARIIVDSPEQAMHSGEINVPLTTGALTPRNIAASLGEVVIGKKPGRVTERDITLFDSTGLAIQDVAVAACVYQRAVELQRGTKVPL